jgi:hypothetical protein
MGGGDQKSRTLPAETDRLAKFLCAGVSRGGVLPFKVIGKGA